MIKNLQRQLNPGGHIKIGKKGKMITSKNNKEFRPPEKIDHFQLVTTEKDSEDDYIRDTALEDAIKKTEQGIINEAGNLIGLPIRLVYNDIESIFPNRYVSYVSGKLSCHGDGEFSQKRLDNFEKQHPCPCQRINPGYDGNDKCKPTGTLTCVIDAAGLFGQAHTFRTTSMNTIRGILGGIEMISEATYGKIAWLPLILTINEKNTTTPGGIPTKVYVVSVCFRGSVDQLRERVLKQLATDKQYLLDTKTVIINPLPNVDTEDEKDFVNEFFPEKSGQVQERKEIQNESSIEDKQEAHVENIDHGLIMPDGDYKKIYDRLLSELDIEKAFALVKRLKLDHIKFWLIDNHQWAVFEDKIKKPDLLEIAKTALKRHLLGPDSTDTTTEQSEKEAVDICPECNKAMCETDNGFICTKCQVIINDHNNTSLEDEKPDESQETIEYDPSWDDSGPITPTQCRQLVELKFDLEKVGVLQPDKWTQHVNYFSDKDGNKVIKAVKLTRAQGYTFIKMLEYNLQQITKQH